MVRMVMTMIVMLLVRMMIDDGHAGVVVQNAIASSEERDNAKRRTDCPLSKTPVPQLLPLLLLLLSLLRLLLLLMLLLLCVPLHCIFLNVEKIISSVSVCAGSLCEGLISVLAC